MIHREWSLSKMARREDLPGYLLGVEFVRQRLAWWMTSSIQRIKHLFAPALDRGLGVSCPRWYLEHWPICLMMLAKYTAEPFSVPNSMTRDGCNSPPDLLVIPHTAIGCSNWNSDISGFLVHTSLFGITCGRAFRHCVVSAGEYPGRKTRH